MFAVAVAMFAYANVGLAADAVGASVLAPKIMAVRGETGSGDLAFAPPTELGPSYTIKSTYDFASSADAAAKNGSRPRPVTGSDSMPR